MTIVKGFDATHDGLPSVPAGAQVAGYSTGLGTDIPWTAADWAARPGAIQIDQSPVLTDIDETADVLDIENGAATNAEAAQWFRAALANYKNGVRPGQRLPCLYTYGANVTPLVNQLIKDGVQAGPFLWVAHWGIGEANAEAMLNASGGPFPIVGVQWADGAVANGAPYPANYDFDVWLSDWLESANAPIVPPPVTPPPPPPSPVPPARRNVLTPVAVDGEFGPLTCKAQQFVDFNGDLSKCDGVLGYLSKVSMQLHLGVVPDGVIGYHTTVALQRRVGAPEDGQWGPVTTAHLQAALNAGTY